MKLRIVSFVVLLPALLSVPIDAAAGTIDTVDWTTTNLSAGTTAGTLANGAIGVSFAQSAGEAWNSMPVISENWSSSLATTSFAGGGVSHNTGSLFGTTLEAGPQLQTITFSAPVDDVVLLVNLGNNSSVFNFGSSPVSLLSGHDSVLSGDTISFSAAAVPSNVGFAALIGGAFGPGDPLTFTLGQSGTGIADESVGFTLSAEAVAAATDPAQPQTAVAEPPTVIMLIIGGTILAIWTRRAALGKTAPPSSKKSWRRSRPSLASTK